MNSDVFQIGNLIKKLKIFQTKTDCKLNFTEFGSGSNQGPQQKIEKMDKHFQNTNGGNSPLMKSDLFQIENLIKKSKIKLLANSILPNSD